MRHVAGLESLHPALIIAPVLVLIPLFLTLTPGIAEAATVQDGSEAISGRWVLNQELSDDPRAAITAAAEAAGAEVPLPPGNRGRGRSDEERPCGPRRGPFLGDDELTVAVEADVVALAYGDGRAHVLRPGSQAGSVQRPSRRRGPTEGRRPRGGHGERGGPRMTAAASWQGSALVVEIETPRGHTVHERYEVDAEGRLVRTVELPAPFADEPVVVRRVYDPA